MTRRGNWPRPSKAAGPLTASALGLVAWAGIAHNSGAGWVQALGCLLAGFALLGLCGPAFAAARARIEVVECPADATVGRQSMLEVRSNAPVRVQAVEPPGSPALVGSKQGAIALTPSRRGPLDTVIVRVASAAPFGLLWWHTQLEVALPRTTWVAPQPVPCDPASLMSHRADTSGHQRPINDHSGTIRGVRPYVVGDPQRSIHWPATAHWGDLMVREAERPQEEIHHLRVVLPADEANADAVAARALGAIIELLARGPVLLSTTERNGLRTEPLATTAQAARRLARAVSGP